MAYEDTTKKASEVLAVYLYMHDGNRAPVLVVDNITAAHLVQSGDWRARTIPPEGDRPRLFFWEDALIHIDGSLHSVVEMYAADKTHVAAAMAIDKSQMRPIIPQAIAQALAFIQSTATEGLGHGTGAEVALRLILRRAVEARKLCDEY